MTELQRISRIIKVKRKVKFTMITQDFLKMSCAVAALSAAVNVPTYGQKRTKNLAVKSQLCTLTLLLRFLDCKCESLIGIQCYGLRAGGK